MKICSIYNVYNKLKTPVAYLVYYDMAGIFYIEICSDADISDTPMLFALFMKKGVYSIDSEWSKKWVQSRIIPSDRQNLGMILKAEKMKYYDEYTFLIKSKGKCSHDDFCVEEIPIKNINNTILPERWKENINDIIVNKEEMLVFFNDETMKKYNINDFIDDKSQLNYAIEHSNDFMIMPGGYELNCNDIVFVSKQQLKSCGEQTNLSLAYFKLFAKNNLINTSAACEMLNCSRQNIDDLVKRDKLEPVHQSEKNKMFLKADINKKRW